MNSKGIIFFLIFLSLDIGVYGQDVNSLYVTDYFNFTIKEKTFNVRNDFSAQYRFHKWVAGGIGLDYQTEKLETYDPYGNPQNPIQFHYVFPYLSTEVYFYSSDLFSIGLQNKVSKGILSWEESVNLVVIPIDQTGNIDDYFITLTNSYKKQQTRFSTSLFIRARIKKNSMLFLNTFQFNHYRGFPRTESSFLAHPRYWNVGYTHQFKLGKK